MRFIVQSQSTGRFLCPDLRDGQPTWVRSLAEAGGGVVSEPERALQLLQDWADLDDEPVIVNLDALGTADEEVPLGAYLGESPEH